MVQYSKLVGLDVHKETIAVAVAERWTGEPVFRGEIPNTSTALKKPMRKLSPRGEVVGFCYEAGPCGYRLHDLPGDRECGARQYCRRTFPDTEEGWRPSED